MSKKKLEKKCVKGIHYGNFSFNSNDLTGVNEDSNLFKIPYGDFSNSFVVNKNELVMEMNLNDEKDE